LVGEPTIIFCNMYNRRGKECRICHISKDLSSFKKRSERNVYRNECKDCQSIISKRYREKNSAILKKRRSEVYHANKPRHVKTREKHGMSDTPIYACWAKMKSRCNNIKDKYYRQYGGRGIKVCERWNKFSEFFKDMGESYSQELSIERIDVNKGYFPSNVRWATASEQSLNKTNSTFLEHNGVRQTVSQWAKQIGLSDGALRHRIRVGWDTKRILETPSLRSTYLPRSQRTF